MVLLRGNPAEISQQMYARLLEKRFKGLLLQRMVPAGLIWFNPCSVAQAVELTLNEPVIAGAASKS